MFLDYETLKLIWWLFMGVILIGFAITDGFDLGIGSLLPFIGQSDDERRVIINAIGPTWDGNQVWLVTAGGALFAAWPLVYAAAFSGFYVALLLVLFALFMRPVGFEYRNKMEDERWRRFWDWGLFAGGFVPALIFGVAFGNLLLGVPFHFDDTMRLFYTGSFWGLLNPFALLVGVVSVSMLIMHGALFLQVRTQGRLYERSRLAAFWAVVTFLVSFSLAGLWVTLALDGHVIETMPPLGESFMPTAKTVSVVEGGWLLNYQQYPWTMVIPVAAYAGALLAVLLSRIDRPGLGFICSGVSVSSVVLTAGFAMFPFVMPSSSHPDQGLTMWDAVSSALTLEIMFFVTILFLPLIVMYTSWVYRVMSGKVTEQAVRENSHSLY